MEKIIEYSKTKHFLLEKICRQQAVVLDTVREESVGDIKEVAEG